METFFDIAGGREGLHHFVDIFYTSVLADPVLQPLFGEGHPHHVDSLTAFLSEIFGGPDEFTQTLGGYQHIIDVHRHLKISEEQRQRFVDLYMTAADHAGLNADPRFRTMLLLQVEAGTQIAKQNSHATTEDELHPSREMPIFNLPTSRP
jgi:hemoglobin